MLRGGKMSGCSRPTGAALLFFHMITLLIYHVQAFATSFIHTDDPDLLAIPTGIPSSIQLVDLRRNAIHHIDNTSLAALNNLDILKMSFNQLVYVHPRAFCGTQLRALGLNGNNLASVPDISCLENSLEIIYLSSNAIQTIGISDFRKLYVLQKVEIKYNRIHQVSGMDVNLGGSLQILTLQGNFLESLAINWSYFKGLHTIDLGQNQLVELTTAGLNMSVLDTLLLPENNLTCFKVVCAYFFLTLSWQNGDGFFFHLSTS